MLRCFTISMAGDFYRKTAALFEEFKKSELHYLNAEASASFNHRIGTNTTLEDRLQKINKRSKEYKDLGANILRDIDRCATVIDELCVDLDQLKFQTDSTPSHGYENISRTTAESNHIAIGPSTLPVLGYPHQHSNQSKAFDFSTNRVPEASNAIGLVHSSMQLEHGEVCNIQNDVLWSYEVKANASTKNVVPVPLSEDASKAAETSVAPMTQSPELLGQTAFIAGKPEDSLSLEEGELTSAQIQLFKQQIPLSSSLSSTNHIAEPVAGTNQKPAPVSNISEGEVCGEGQIQDSERHEFDFLEADDSKDLSDQMSVDDEEVKLKSAQVHEWLKGADLSPGEILVNKEVAGHQAEPNKDLSSEGMPSPNAKKSLDYDLKLTATKNALPASNNTEVQSSTSSSEVNLKNMQGRGFRKPSLYEMFTAKDVSNQVSDSEVDDELENMLAGKLAKKSPDLHDKKSSLVDDVKDDIKSGSAVDNIEKETQRDLSSSKAVSTKTVQQTITKKARKVPFKIDSSSSSEVNVSFLPKNVPKPVDSDEFDFYD